MRIVSLTAAFGLAAATFVGAGGPASALDPGPSRATIAATHTGTVVRAVDGRPYGTGENTDGPLTGTGQRQTLTPMVGLPSGVRATVVAGGPYWTSVVVGSDGRVYGAGLNSAGSLTGTAVRYTRLQALTGLPSGVRAVDAATGNWFTLVLGSDGRVYGTGTNGDGNLTGSGDRSTLSPLAGLPSGVTAVDIAAGARHSLVAASNGRVYGAGLNNFGQLTGAGSRATLTQLSGLPLAHNAVSVSAGLRHSLVLTDSGRVYGTGLNSDGQLTGTVSAHTTLYQMASGAVAVSAGMTHSAILRYDGKLLLTGANGFGQVTGDVPRRTAMLVADVPGGGGVEISATNSDHTLVKSRNGLVYGFGRNAWRQLTSANPLYVRTPRPISGQVLGVRVAPRVLGAARVGERLRATTGAWTPTASSYAYQWLRNGRAIRRATGSAYTVRADDLGSRLRVRVTARVGSYAQGRATSAQTARVRPGARLRYTRPNPRIAGRQQVGRRLNVRVSAAGFSPRAQRLRYQWYRGSRQIRGATGSAYRTRAADRGTRLQVRIVGTRPGHPSGEVRSQRAAIR